MYCILCTVYYLHKVVCESYAGVYVSIEWVDGHTLVIPEQCFPILPILTQGGGIVVEQLNG